MMCEEGQKKDDVSKVPQKKNPDTSLESVGASRSSSSHQERAQPLWGSPRVPPYLYLSPHANGSCETSQTFFPTVTFSQSGARDTRPEGGRLVVGALPLAVWPRWSWRVQGAAGEKKICLQPSIIAAFTH